jgi:L-fuconolactonase
MAMLRRDFLAADIAEEMRAAGVDGSVVVQARQSLAETEWLLGLADTSPVIRGVVGWVPLLDADLPRRLIALKSRSKLKGVRHVVQDEPDDNFILRDDFNRGVSALLDTGLVYDILIHERHLPQAAIFAARHPQQVFVLDHLAKPLIREGAMQPWRDNLMRLAENQNVYCKVSGLVTEAEWSAWTAKTLQPYLDAALEAFGVERLLAGSDWPVCLLASGYEQWWSVLREWCDGLSREGKELVLGETTERVYRLV